MLQLGSNHSVPTIIESNEDQPLFLGGSQTVQGLEESKGQPTWREKHNSEWAAQ